MPGDGSLCLERAAAEHDEHEQGTARQIKCLSTKSHSRCSSSAWGVRTNVQLLQLDQHCGTATRRADGAGLRRVGTAVLASAPVRRQLRAEGCSLRNATPLTCRLACDASTAPGNAGARPAGHVPERAG